MGWQDDPVVAGGWQNDPVIGSDAPSPRQRMASAAADAMQSIFPLPGGPDTESAERAIGASAGMSMPEIPIPAAVSDAVGGAIGKAGDFANSLGNKLAARMLKGTAGEYRALGPEGVQKLGDFLVNQNAVRFGSSPAQVAERIPALAQSTGEALGDSIKALDSTGGKLSKQALADRFLKLADEARAGGPGTAPLVAKYENAAAAIGKDIQETGEPMMSFGQGEKWKQNYQAPINYAKANSTPIEMGSKEIASAARQHVEDAAEIAGTGSDLGDNFLAAKQDSGLAQQAAAMAKGAEGRATARGMVGPVAKAASFTGAGLALAHGNLPAAAVSLAVPPTAQFLAARAPSAAAITLKSAASGMQKLQAIVRSNPGAIGRYGAILSKALSEGDQSFAAHTYALSQSDPQAQELFRKLEGQ